MPGPSLIQIKRSLNTSIPGALANGEFGYTSNGDILYIGANGAIVPIAGARTSGVLTANQDITVNSTSMIDKIMFGNSTVNAVANSLSLKLSNSTVSWTLVKPSAAQVSSADYYPASDGVWKQIASSAVADLDDLSDVTLTATANNDLLVYDNVASQWVNKAVGNGFSFVSQVLKVLGGSTLTVNTTGVHVNSTLSITDLALSGNLTVSGTLTTIDVTNLVVNDSIIELAQHNAANTIDIGLYGTYNDGTERYAGLVWNADVLNFELFANTTAEPTTTVNLAGTGYTRGKLNAYLRTGWGTGIFEANSTGVTLTANSTWAVAIAANTLSLSTPLPGTSGGTGLSAVTAQDILVGNSTNGFTKLGIGSTGYVLQANSTGGLEYNTLDGGTF